MLSSGSMTVATVVTTPLTTYVSHHATGSPLAGDPEAPRRRSSTIWSGRTRLRIGTNQPPMAQPEPWRSCSQCIRSLRWARNSQVMNSTPPAR